MTPLPQWPVTLPGTSSPGIAPCRRGAPARPTAPTWRHCCAPGRYAATRNAATTSAAPGHRQVEILEGAARGNLCAGVVRYELAQLYDLTGRHV